MTPKFTTTAAARTSHLIVHDRVHPHQAHNLSNRGNRPSGSSTERMFRRVLEHGYDRPQLETLLRRQRSPVARRQLSWACRRVDLLLMANRILRARGETCAWRRSSCRNHPERIADHRCMEADLPLHTGDVALAALTPATTNLLRFMFESTRFVLFVLCGPGSTLFCVAFRSEPFLSILPN